MLAENRRMERRKDWVELLKHTLGISEVSDFSSEELKGNFLKEPGAWFSTGKIKLPTPIFLPEQILNCFGNGVMK